MKTINSIIVSFCAVSVLGCTVPSIEIVDNQKPTFKEITGGVTRQINPEIQGVQKVRIYHTGLTGFIPEGTIRDGALKEVEAYCSQSGKRPYLIEETASTPPYILGNWQRIEVLFSCIEGTP